MTTSTDLRLIHSMLAQPVTDAEREAIRWKLSSLILQTERLERTMHEVIADAAEDEVIGNVVCLLSAARGRQ